MSRDDRAARQAAVQREALRQQMLLRALWRDARPGVVAGWLRDAPQRFERGLAAYQANAAALAERALAAAYPVLQQLIGEASFATLARVFWHRHPPERGDLAAWGGALPALIEDSDSLADEPYLADVARLEWALHVAETAADAPDAPPGIERLAQDDPAAIVLRAAASLVLLESPHPIGTIWRAHRRADGDDRFAPVREAFAAGRGETALVCRDGLRPEVLLVAEPQARFMRALLGGSTLAVSLDQGGVGFDFADWLVQALRRRWIAAIEPV